MRKKRFCAAIAVTLALCLAAGCAANESQPVVTNDDLTPFSTVADTENGQGGEAQPVASVPEKKDYAYIWPAEDMETSTEELRRQLFEEHEFDTDGFSGQQTVEDYQQAMQDWIDERIADSRRYWEEQRALDPIVSPQEAANRAGQLFETFYGIDLTNKTLRMSCWEADASLFPTENMPRTLWRVRVGDDSDDGSTVEPPIGTYIQAECQLDTTTGEVVETQWFVSDEEYSRIKEGPMSDCFIPAKNPDLWMSGGGWDETHPNFAATVNTLMEEITPLVSDSILTNGAAIISAEYQLFDQETSSDETSNRLCFFFTCENGKTYLIRKRIDSLQPYLEYDFDGYPMRAYGCWLYSDT